MIEYIVSNNPDDRIMQKAVNSLNNGNIICFPTDTNWTLAGLLSSKVAQQKIYKLKCEDISKHFSVLCSSLSMASTICTIPDYAFKLIRGTLPGHYTYIFEANKKLIKNLKASKRDKEVGIRIVPTSFVNSIIELCNTPLICTNITNKLLGIPKEDEVYSLLIDENLKGKCDLILDPCDYDFVGPSTIYQFSNQEINLIREGSGKLL